MNWWKTAQARDFTDRNILNERIDYLKETVVSLTRLSKIAFQTGSDTKRMLEEILESKRLSTYPVIQKLLQEATTKSLDSPHKTSDLCKKAAAQIVFRVNELQKERHKLITKTMPNRWKGWRI